MAQVQYMVMYRYMHPVANKPVTNKQKGYKSFCADTKSNPSGVTTVLTADSEFKATDLPVNPTTGTPYPIDEYISARNYTTDKVYDMLFVFTNVGTIADGIKEGIAPTITNHKLQSDMFEQVNGDPWFVASITGSLESAMATAKRLVMKIGINNVKVVKQVPLELQVEIE